MKKLLVIGSMLSSLAVATSSAFGADLTSNFTASFGAYGAPLPYDAVKAGGEFTLLTVERHPPQDLEYPDLVAAAWREFNDGV